MTVVFSEGMAWVFELIGVFGFVLYVANYSLLSFGLVSSDSARYFILNFWAASFVLVGLSVNFNLPSALIQLFWIAISTVGIASRLWLRPQKPASVL